MAGGHVWQGGMHGRGVCVVGEGVYGGGHTWWGACMAGGACMVGGMHGRGYVMGACLAEEHAWQGGVHDRGHHKIRVVNVRSVCILLECIFVDFIFFCQFPGQN